MTEKEMFQSGESAVIDLKSILFKYLRYWYLFLACMVICIGFAFLFLARAIPEYRVQSTLLIKDDKKGPAGAGGAMFSDLDIFGSSKNIDNEIEILKSKTLMQRVIKELNLQTSYYEESFLKAKEIYGRDLPLRLIINNLDSTQFDEEMGFRVHILSNNSFELEEVKEEEGDEEVELNTYKFGQDIKKPYGNFTIIANPNDPSFIKGKTFIIQHHNIKKLSDFYNKILLNIETVNKSASVIMISFISPVKEKSIDIINTLIKVYEKEAVEDKNLIASNTVQFIDERLRYLTAELAEVEKGVEEYKKQHELTNVTSEATLFLEQASENKKQLLELEIQIDILNSIENYLKNQEGDFEIVPSTLNIEEPTLLILVSQFNKLQLERERMLRTSRPNNPLVLDISKQLEQLRVNILETLSNIRKGFYVTRKSLQTSSKGFKSRIQQVPSIERELMEISRQQGIKEALYLYLLQKREESALSLAATVSTNSRVIDPAMAEDVPVKPKRFLIFMIALGIGVCLPIAFIWIKDQLNDKVKELTDVAQATKTPIIGEIYHNTTGDVIVAKEKNKSPIAELFRLIRTNLQFATIGKENKIIMVTSSMSGDGKTFISINLAATLALTGKKVVIVGFDLRKPRLMQDMGLSAASLGVSNYLISDNLSLDDIIVSSQVSPNLRVIGSGSVPPNPGELMLSSKIETLINELKERFEYIVIDSSPVGQISDSFTLAPYIDSTIYVVRYNYTFKSQLEIIDDIYKNKKLSHPMIVLNGKDENTYGGYGYGYGHEEKKSFYQRVRDKFGV